MREEAKKEEVGAAAIHTSQSTQREVGPHPKVTHLRTRCGLHREASERNYAIKRKMGAGVVVAQRRECVVLEGFEHANV